MGWAITALLGVNTVGAAVIGTTIAYVIFQYAGNKKTEEAAPAASDELGGEL